MPSGSHGGSAGSHGGFSGGGSRGSSFGRSSGSRNQGSFRPRGPRPFRFGGRVYILSTGRQSVLSIILIIGILLLGSIFMQFSALSDYNEHLKMIEEENRYYIAMVQNAAVNTEYMVKGEVEDQFYKSEYGKYYITYTFKADSGANVEGYTFSIYGLNNIPAKGSEIWIAVNDKTTDSDTDSVPMDYVNFTLEDDGEYQLFKKQRNSTITKMVILGVVVVALVGGYILVIVTAKKKQEEKEEAEKAEAKAKEEAEEKKRFCEYCGARVEPADNVCPQCGARLL